SMIPPGWHGWMHHRVAVPPSQEDYAAKEWEMPHEGNPTGSAAAYRPAGSILAPGQPAGTRSEYEPWRP
ncbi:MAG: NADH-ubiquinone oxidoreductase subunit NDUFA12 family protein, partial [Rhabdaerophilum sp.]